MRRSRPRKRKSERANRGRQRSHRHVIRNDQTLKKTISSVTRRVAHHESPNLSYSISYINRADVKCQIEWKNTYPWYIPLRLHAAAMNMHTTGGAAQEEINSGRWAWFIEMFEGVGVTVLVTIFGFTVLATSGTQRFLAENGDDTAIALTGFWLSVQEAFRRKTLLWNDVFSRSRCMSRPSKTPFRS